MKTQAPGQSRIETYLGPCQKSVIDVFSENSGRANSFVRSSSGSEIHLENSELQKKSLTNKKQQH